MKLKTFKHGSHPKEFKEFAEHKLLETLPIPDEVFIPVTQHIGAPCKPCVKKGDEVKTGQLIAESAGFVSSNIHASISGKVKAVAAFPHPNGSKSIMIHIVGDGNDEWIETEKVSDWEKLGKDELKKLISDAGIVGMGGAAFPTHVKLSPPKDKPIDTFIINGCECEPYLTADHRMMAEQTEKMVLGTAVVDKEVPTGSLPMDVGAVVNNVGTAIAVAEAVIEGKPVVERVVTVTGDAINEPKNVIARIGTPFSKLLEYCGGLKPDTRKVLMGGPMMGVAQYSLEVPVVKATSGILCLSTDSVPEIKEYACIMCGKCVEACPMFLLPTRLSKAVSKEKYEMAEELGIMNCIECGSCSYVCPSNLPLVHQIRIGKLKINEKNKK